MALSLDSYALQGQLNLSSPQPSPPQAPEVPFHLTRAQLSSPSCGWWRSSHFCSIYALGFHDSQRKSKQPFWGGAISGLGSRYHSVGGSSFTERTGVVRSFLYPSLLGPALAPFCLPVCGSIFLPESPSVGCLSLHLYVIMFLPVCLCIYICFSLGLFHILAPGPLHWLFPGTRFLHISKGLLPHFLQGYSQMSPSQ